MYYEKHKKNKIGKCNICKKHGELSWDHVPPRALQLTPVQITSIYNKVVGNGKPEISQNGLKYRTICSSCNNNVGTWYDSHLIEISKTITAFIETSLVLPEELTIKIMPIKLIKSIIAHMLTARLDFRENEFEDALRKSVIDFNEKIPEWVNLFYWIYPCQTVKIVRSILLIDNFNDLNSLANSSIIKFYPLGFLMTYSTTYKDKPSLTQYRDLAINDAVDLKINLKNIEESEWPEKQCQAVLYGKDGLDGKSAMPKVKGLIKI